jgi:hypothetical protein
MVTWVTPGGTVKPGPAAPVKETVQVTVGLPEQDGFVPAGALVKPREGLAVVGVELLEPPPQAAATTVTPEETDRHPPPQRIHFALPGSPLRL